MSSVERPIDGGTRQTSPRAAGRPPSRISRSRPSAEVVNIDGAHGWTTVPVMYPPPISVPPQYSTIGRYPARNIRYSISSGVDGSAVELNTRIRCQSSPSIALSVFQLRTSFGTTPSIVTRDRARNSPNARVVVAPTYRAIVAWFTRLAYVSQGPIIHPKLVGQASTSDGRTSWWRYASAALLIGVVCVHGIAFGSFVVPDENRMFVWSEGRPGTASYVSRSLRKSAHPMSLRAVCVFSPVRGMTIVWGPSASITFE